MDKIPLIRNWLDRTHQNQVIYSVIYGSLTYGTSTNDSDIDLIIVLKDEYPNNPEDTISLYDKYIGNIDITYYTLTKFQQNLKDNEVKTVESIFIPEQFVIHGSQILFRENFVCTP